MAVTKTHILSDETGQEMLAELRRIAAAQETGSTAPVYDATSGKYTNASLDAWLHANLDERIFTVRIPKWETSHGTACEKLDDNAGLVVVPSTNATAGRDDYRNIQAFQHWDVNGGAADTGTPFVTAIEGREGGFSRHGANGNVFVMTRTLFWRVYEDGGYQYLSISAYPHPGFEVQPGGLLPDGTMRPYMLYAKYAMGTYDSKAASVSGIPCRNRNVSHNTSISLAATLGDGYSGRSIADDWYVKVMFLVKYAKKSSQEVFAGCSSYNLQYAATLAEEGVRRVVIAKTNAANLLVGSWMMFGTHAGDNPGNDRGTAVNYNVFDGLKITRIEDVDANNTAIYFDDAASTFDTGVGYLLSTAPWGSGSCDRVLGSDGSPYDPLSAKEPFVLQGIECMVGVYEVSGVVMLKYDSNGCHVMAVYDSHKASSSAPTADYEDTGLLLYQGSSDASHFGVDFGFGGGVIAPQGDGASATSGVGDPAYVKQTGTTGSYEWRAFGTLYNGGHAGLACVNALAGLSGAHWDFGGRLSVTGRSRG